VQDLKSLKQLMCVCACVCMCVTVMDFSLPSLLVALETLGELYEESACPQHTSALGDGLLRVRRGHRASIIITARDSLGRVLGPAGSRLLGHRVCSNPYISVAMTQKKERKFVMHLCSSLVCWARQVSPAAGSPCFSKSVIQVSDSNDQKRTNVLQTVLVMTRASHPSCQCTWTPNAFTPRTSPHVPPIAGSGEMLQVELTTHLNPPLALPDADADPSNPAAAAAAAAADGGASVCVYSLWCVFSASTRSNVWMEECMCT
jgi:hypothetical protein